ncbi:MAG: aminopeptidase P family protein [Thermoplasmata archaeon]|nr:MAG: aminopeptidase P family protein [Thermoplasmata archaeon]
MNNIISHPKTPKEEIVKRVSRLQNEMTSENIDGVMILQQADKFYFSGTVQNGVIFIPVDGTPIFMVRKSLERAQEESELDNIVPFKSYSQIPGIIKEHGFTSLSKIGLELDVMPVAIFRKLEGTFSGTEIIDASKSIRKIRMVKSEYEIKTMKKAGKILKGAMEEVPNLLAEGKSEIELAAETEIILRKKGHQGIIRMRKWNQECFYGLILSGESGAISNYMDAPLGGMGPCPAAPRGASPKKIKKKEPIIIDMVSAYNGYVVDCTRTFYIGELDQKLLKALDLSLQIQEAVIQEFKSNVNLREIYDMAQKMASDAGFGDYFMGFGNSKVRFLGHGVGLELDELPVIAEGFDFTLEENMTVAIEPKFLFPKVGAVGVENTWASKKGRPEKITEMEDVLIK